MEQMGPALLASVFVDAPIRTDMKQGEKQELIEMDEYEHIRTAQRVYKKSIRQIARETGHTRKTVRKALLGLLPKYRRKGDPACGVMDPVALVVEGWLNGDQQESKKQRHTAHRIYTRLVEEHAFKGGESTVRQWVRKQKARMGLNAAQAVVPLDAEVAREAEVDWGSAWVEVAGERQLIKFF